MSSFDVIIVGAGAAGCVLAGRLSEVASRRVLLLEAGPDAPPGEEHPDILDPFPVSLGNPRFLWSGFEAEAGADPGNGQRVATPYAQGCGVGGGSNVNGMWVERGLPEDYDTWRDIGAVGWGWNDVLPYFKKIEKDEDFSGPFHGNEGPFPVRRVRPSEWAPLAKALGRALQRRGYPFIDDHTTDFRDGVMSMPMNSRPNQRVSASMVYLTKAVRSRRNLTILPNARAERLEFRDGRARGVIVSTREGVRQFEGEETIVACGALHTPALLMRSGVGPAQHLRALGIEVVRDSPGVGRNLQNHPTAMLVTHLPRAAMQSATQRGWQQNLLRYSSNHADCAQHDMVIAPASKVAWHSLGKRVGALMVMVLKAYSIGSVELASADAAVGPHVRFNTLSDSRDCERMVEGLRLALELLADNELAGVRNEVFIPNGKIVNRLAKRSAWNRLLARGITAAFDIAPLRRALLKKGTIDVRAMAADSEAVRQYVKQASQAAGHVCGTCRMGSAEDSGAVVDPDCRVRGVRGLRVIDASVFPTIPRANTHFPVLMVAEKMADQIQAQWGTVSQSARV